MIGSGCTHAPSDEHGQVRRPHAGEAQRLVAVVATLSKGYDLDYIWKQVDRGPAKDSAGYNLRASETGGEPPCMVAVIQSWPPHTGWSSGTPNLMAPTCPITLATDNADRRAYSAVGSGDVNAQPDRGDRRRKLVPADGSARAGAARAAAPGTVPDPPVHMPGILRARRGRPERDLGHTRDGRERPSPRRRRDGYRRRRGTHRAPDRPLGYITDDVLQSSANHA